MAWRFNGFGFDEAAFRRELDNVVQETAEAVAAEAAVLAPVDTGALESSLYASGPVGSDYDKAAAQMRERNSRVELEPEIARNEDEPGKHSAIVSSAAPYAALVHDGHFNIKNGRFVDGRAFLANALQQQKEGFEQRQRIALEKFKQKN
jgi:hypothetical protein